MQSKKLAFSNDVIHIVRELCGLVFNAKTEEQLEKIFGISHEKMATVIHKIINALPDHLFDQTNTETLEEMKSICAREYVFFQAQEKWNDPNYTNDLLNFTYIFSRDLQSKFKAGGVLNKKTRSRLKEG